MKNLAMLPSYFDYIFVRLRQKARLRPELSPKFLSTLGPNPPQIRISPEKPGPIYNSGPVCNSKLAIDKNLRPMRIEGTIEKHYKMLEILKPRVYVSVEPQFDLK